MTEPYSWWQRGIVYHVYPRSFADSDGDGVGDLPGIKGKLEYLAWLGVDAAWLSPIYPSPMADFGYDITDYAGVDPLFGTLSDFDGLVAEAHRLGLKVLLDFVPNHTSREHPWFREARSSRESTRREWYLWADPAADGGPPNNWLSVFGGPAWTWDEETNQYYHHAYLPEQPDLDWNNPEVGQAMLGVLRFWLNRGVDGFRVDALRRLVVDRELRDDPPNPGYRPGQNPYESLLPVHTTDRPEVHGAIAAMRQTLDEEAEPGERLLIGELYLPIERLVRYYGDDGTGVHLPSNMHLISTPHRAEDIGALVEVYEAALPEGAWPNWVLGNHDRSRVASRVGSGQARVAAMLLLTLRGTPTLYYGDELGMRDADIPPEMVRDPHEKNVPGIGVGRDPERTPMQWDASANAGFCPEGVEPWLPVAEDHEAVNVVAEADDPRSMLALHRRLIALRRREPALSAGSYAPIFAGGDLLAYEREHEGRRFLVALNLGPELRDLDLADRDLSGRISVSTHLDREGEEIRGGLRLRPDEGAVIELRDGPGAGRQ